MKLADARLCAAEDLEDWKSVPFLHKLDRLDTDEGHEIWGWYSEYSEEHGDSEWQIVFARTWLNWSFGFSVQVEPSYGTAASTVWLNLNLGPFVLGITRHRWPRHGE